MSFLFFTSRFCIWENTCSICLSESDIFHLTCWSPVSPIFLQMTLIFPCVW
jgi:hypothetical protein